MMNTTPLTRLCMLAAWLAVALVPPARASDDERRDRTTTAQAQLPAYRQECTACHVAYPPNLLPAASWQQLMANLPRHFGTDASLDDPNQRAIAQWLASQASDAPGRRKVRVATPPPDHRITRSAWFVREHDEVSPATWRSAAVKSAANCQACHTKADQGDFNEHDVRIPR